MQKEIMALIIIVIFIVILIFKVILVKIIIRIYEKYIDFDC